MILRQSIIDFLAHCKDTCAAMTHWTYEYKLRVMAEQFWGPRDMLDKHVEVAFRHGNIRALYDWMVNVAGYKYSSVQAMRVPVSSLGRWLTDRAIIPHNYAKLVDPARLYSFPVDLSKTKQPITEDEYAKLLAGCTGEDEFWEVPIRLGWECGMRIGDVCMLRRDAVDHVNRALRIIPSKTRRHRRPVEMPLSLETYKKLMRYHNRKTTPYVFATLAKLYTESSVRLSTRFMKFCRKQGVFGKSFHCLRYSVATRMHNAGATTEQISSVTGQCDRTVKHYIKITLDDKRRLLGLT